MSNSTPTVSKEKWNRNESFLWCYFWPNLGAQKDLGNCWDLIGISYARILSINSLPGGHSSDEGTCSLTEKATLREEGGARLVFVTACLKAVPRRLCEPIVKKTETPCCPFIVNLLHQNVWDSPRNLHFE